MNIEFTTDERLAKKLDREDSLAGFRQQFYIPKDTIYMLGNSLGLLSKDAEKSLHRVLEQWKDHAIGGWLGGNTPWFYLAEKLGAMAAPLVGAAEDEVVATGTTTVNIHSLMSTFYIPRGGRTKILADELDFPSDIYALQGQIGLKGLDPEENLVLVPSKDGRTLDEETIVEYMSDEVAVALLPSVLYRSGQLLDIPFLTQKAHEKGIMIGFDCSHSVGAVPHKLSEWDVDFAMWCSYKYLNSGPGSTAFLYLNSKHFERTPCLAGWFGYIKEKQFEMRLDFQHAKSAGGWQISSPCILSAAPIEGSLKIFQEAGMETVREKSLNMTSYLIYLIDEIIAPPPYNVTIGSPRNPERRGGHVALERDEDSWNICQALKERGVITDFRPPNIIRIAPTALYNTYYELWQVVHHIKDIIDKGEYKSIPSATSEIT